MDKRPPYLIITETGGVEIQIFADDSPMMVKIKEFMALYCVVDIKMRMLTVVEPVTYPRLSERLHTHRNTGGTKEVYRQCRRGDNRPKAV